MTFTPPVFRPPVFRPHTFPPSLDPEASALLVIDVQEKLLNAMPKDLAERCVRHTRNLCIGANALGIPVIITEQYPKGLGHTVTPILEVSAGATVVEKTVFDASAVPAVVEALSGRTQIVLAGMEAHICVFQTARGLAQKDFWVAVAADATCSRDEGHRRIAEKLWSEHGALVTCGEAVLFDWLGKAGGEAFRTISKAIR